jgi:hypothetical protein
MIEPYLVLKWLHIISSTLLFGTGLGTAFHGWMSMRSGNPQALAVIGRSVVMADWIFTTPAVIIQPITGILLVQHLGHAWNEPWLLLSLGLYLFVGACWLPVVWLQIQLRRMAETALRQGTELPGQYYRMARIWFVLGWPAFIGVLIIFWLMIARPNFAAYWP